MRSFCEQAKKIKQLVEIAEEDLEKLERFEPTDYIKQHCARLSRQVEQAAAKAVDCIHLIDAEQGQQIQAQGNRCLAQRLSFRRALKQRVNCKPNSDQVGSFTKDMNDQSVGADDQSSTVISLDQNVDNG